MTRLASIATRQLGRLWSSADGNIAMIFGLSAIPLFIAGGMGIDMWRAYSTQMRLETALDAAALAVGSTNPGSAGWVATNTTLTSRLQAFFTANYPASAIGTPGTPTLTVDSSNSQALDFAVSATVPTVFMSVVGINSLSVHVTNQITLGQSLEVALVLDNTGSMFYTPSGSSTNNITALKNDTTELINTLFEFAPDTSKLKIAIVPYVTSVNPGSKVDSNTAYVKTPYKYPSGTAITDYAGKAVTYDNTTGALTPEWKGCVIEPNTSTNQDVSEPSGGWTGPWTPMYSAASSFDSSNIKNGGDNPWTYTSSSVNNFSYPANSSSDAACLYANGSGLSKTSGLETMGPNMACPTPITELTNDQTTLLNAVTALQAWCRSGTMIHVGAVWGWRAVSPNPPLADGAAYNTPNLKKAVVIETDGVNDWDNWQSTFTGDTNNGDESGFGRMSDNLLGTSVTASNATSKLDARLTTLCTNMNAAGITVYAVAFSGSGTAASSALQNCASQPSYYFAPTNQAELQSAFQQIALSLNQLRLSK